MSSIIHHPHDKFFKKMMEDIRVAKDFFTKHLPPELLSRCDLNTLKIEKNSFVDRIFKDKESDVLYRIMIDGSVGYFYLLCEQQSEIDHFIAFRLLTYRMLIMEQHHKQYPESTLPIVHPFVIYSGEQIWDAPTDIFELFGKNQKLAEQWFIKPFQLIDLQAMGNDILEKHLWTGLLEFVLKYRRIQDLERYLQTLLPLISQIEIQGGSDLGEIVITYVVNRTDQIDWEVFSQQCEIYLSNEMRGKTMTIAEQLIAKGQARGEDIGEARGRLKTLTFVVKNLVKDGYNTAEIKKITKLSDEEIENIIEEKDLV